MTAEDRAIKHVYVAVLLQAFKDAMTDRSLSKRCSSIDKYETLLCRNYLTQYSKDLDLVCQIAQVDIEVVMNTANKLKESDWIFTGERIKTKRNKGGVPNRNFPISRMVKR